MTKSRHHYLILIFCIMMIITAGAAGAKQDNAGFIYGKVMTESGKEYRGFLRWGSEEAFWDDLFHSSKEDLPYLEEYEDEVRRSSRRERKKKSYKVFGYELKVNHNIGYGSGSRVFICRFGQIKEIEVIGDSARLLMKSGEHVDVSGYANDVGGTVQVKDDELGEVNLHWDRIERIEFMAAPRGADPGVERLYGKLSTRYGDFEGFVQWDKQECLSIDELDGEGEDGDISIPMGKIESIERHGRRGSQVTLKSGRELHLRNSNDVDHDNRGIMIEDPRFGRVVVFWDEFDRLQFTSTKSSGKGYKDYKGSERLSGTVTDIDGDKHQGRLVFDLDETQGWEMLNGSQSDMEYNIPFRMIRSIEPRGRRGSLIKLIDGQELDLEDAQDVSENNDGVLILDGGKGYDGTYISWDEIELIELQ
jgi:hypothetical protein